MGVRSTIFAGLVAAGVTATAQAGVLRGKVTLSAPTRPVQTAALNPYAGQLGGGDTKHAEAPHRTTPADVIIYLEGVPETGDHAASRRPQLKQIDINFEPRVIGIPVGGTVEFPNEDLVLHNVFSYSKTKRFDLGYYGHGKSKSVRFDKPGLVKVFCDIHSSMNACILVVDTQFVVQPTEEGAYELTNVPEGKYTLKIWHPDLGERTQTVSITSGVTEHDVSL